MSHDDRRVPRRIALFGSLAVHALLAILVVATPWPPSPFPGSWSNHVWQSTLFAVAVAVLTRGFATNDARIRYWLWFIASIKFLLPFSLLVSIGGALPWTPATISPPELSVVLTQIGEPFGDPDSSAQAAELATSDVSRWSTLVVVAIWVSGAVALLGLRFKMWRHIRRALQTATPIHIGHIQLPPGIRLRAASGILEPGVIGLWRPIILVPAGIDDYLTPDQLRAVLAHELCHVKRRDNLLAALHMLVETVFWFHPLVWWIGSRLTAERERACDEDVVRRHAAPRIYAEGIIRVCERYVEARLPVVAGVSGSDLKQRIEAIMSHRTQEPLSVWKRLLLIATATAAAVVPIAVGAFDAPRLQAQAGGAGDLAFDTASVRRNTSGAPNMTFNAEAEGWVTASNVTPAMLIRFAYDVPGFQVSGGPDWLDSDRFDVTARTGGNPSLLAKRMMLRRMLAERFKLGTHNEKRELPLYALMHSRTDRTLGPRLRRSNADCARVEQPTLFTFVGPAPTDGAPPCGYFGFSPSTNLPSGRGGLAFRGLTMPALATKLMPMVRRTVIDDTGLTGYFDAELDFLAELPPPPPPPGMPNPFAEGFVSVFTVLPEQLGLKLDSRRGQVDVLVIDRAEQPTEN
jgi:bla regulator protein BlaR1